MVSAREAAAAVVDPEIRVVTIDELGILRDVREDPATGRVTVTITPTYTGCPAMDVIRADIRTALRRAGYPDAEVATVYAPAWSTDWISAAGRAKLAAAGIAPPGPAPPRRHTGAAAADRTLPALRLAWTPNRSAGSAPPPARRSGAAAPAVNRSTR